MMQNGGKSGDFVCALKCSLAGDHLIEHRTEREDVGPRIYWAGPEFQWTVDWENLMKEKSHVHRKQTRFWGRAGSPEGD